MRLLLLLSLVITTLLLPAQTAVQQADVAYRQQLNGQYEAAIQRYRALLREGYRDPNLYYNLALAYQNQQQLGYAILYMEKALRLAPYDRGIREHLARAYSEQVDALPPTPTFFLYDWWQRLAARLSPDGWGILALVVLVIGSVVTALSITYPTYKPAPKWWQPWQKKAVPLAVFALSLSVLVGALAWTYQQQLTDKRDGVILAKEAAVYVAPGDDASIDFTIHQGLKVRILDTFADWKKVELPDGRQGWLPMKTLGTITI